MKEGWKYMKLGEVATYINGFAFKPEDWVSEGLPIIRIQNLTEQSKKFNYCKRDDIPLKYNVTDGDVLISWSATLGIFEWKKGKALLNQHIFKVVFDKIEINKQFFKYTVLMSIDEMSKHTNGATMKHIRKGDFDNILIPVPPLSDQQRIVSYLDSEFAKIEALKANAEKQLQAAKDLFQAALKELLTPKEGWEEKKFGDVCHYYKVQGKWENIEYIGLEHIEAHTSNLLATISANDVESSTFKFNKGDVLYGRLRPYLQKVVIAPFDGCCSTEIFPIKSNIINNAFLKYWLLSDRVTEIMINSCSGCRMPRANMNDFKQETIHYPQFEDQQRIADRLDALSANVKALQTNYAETITLCNDLKQSLLKKIFE